MRTTDLSPTKALDPQFIIMTLVDTHVDQWMEANLALRGEENLRRLAHFWDDAKDNKRIIITAWRDHVFCGHITILWQSLYTPFSRLHIPELVDLWVAPEWRSKRLGKSLLHAAEEAIRLRSTITTIGLGVGVTKSFGPAQSLYIKNGYIPDGTGLWVGGKNNVEDIPIILNDDAILMLVKKL